MRSTNQSQSVRAVQPAVLGFLLTLVVSALWVPRGAHAQDPAPSLPPVVRVHHVPVLWAPTDQPLIISVNVEASHRARDIALYVRAAGTGSFERMVFRRMTTDAILFSVTLPVERMVPGVIEYYIASRDMDQASDAGERLHFASPEAPHPIIVVGDAESSRRRRLLSQHLGSRSRFQSHVEYVNFGNRSNSDGSTVSDSYWRADLDYTYRMLGWVYSIRLGAGLLLGQTYLSGVKLLQVPDPTRCSAPNPLPTDCRVGLYYGFAELRFRLGRLARFDLRPILGVGPQSFDGGAAAQLVVGYDPGTHVAVGIEGVSHIGVRGWLRLAWDTVPHLPMAFIIDVENFPNNGDMAMRLMMNFGYRFARHFSVDLTAGYATRGWQVGGPSIGGGLIFEF